MTKTHDSLVPSCFLLNFALDSSAVRQSLTAGPCGTSQAPGFVLLRNGDTGWITCVCVQVQVPCHHYQSSFYRIATCSPIDPWHCAEDQAFAVVQPPSELRSTLFSYPFSIQKPATCNTPGSSTHSALSFLHRDITVPNADVTGQQTAV